MQAICCRWRSGCESFQKQRVLFSLFSPIIYATMEVRI